MAQEPLMSPVKNLDVFSEDPLLQRLHGMFIVFSDNQRHLSPHQAHFIIGQLFRYSRAQILRSHNF